MNKILHISIIHLFEIHKYKFYELYILSSKMYSLLSSGSLTVVWYKNHYLP